VNVRFFAEAWTDYLLWARDDRAVFERLNMLIEDVRRSPFSGLGKPEPLKGRFAGWWSRRITKEHRLVYRIAGKDGDQYMELIACRHHYERG